MKKLIIILYLFLFVIFCYCADFDKYNWEQTKEEVKKLNKGIFIGEQKEILIFQNKDISIFPYINLFYFIKNKLGMVSYYFFPTEKNKDFLSDAFETIKNSTKEKYGDPVEINKNYTLNKYENKFIWISGDIRIVLYYIIKDDSILELGIQYQSMKLQKELEDNFPDINIEVKIDE